MACSNTGSSCRSEISRRLEPPASLACPPSMAAGELSNTNRVLPFRGVVLSLREVTAMEHIAALLLIIGCSDDLGQCRELPPPVSVYETTEECEGDLQRSISLFTTKHPQVFGQCVEVDP